ncbi:MAG TPA: hypothetical protein VMI75_24345 [Polyangiaceae bacterium]|nr:hypothetical protein [Polyangiaceae bacterium]
MSFPLARSLLLADAVTAESLAKALLVSATRGTSLVRALLTTRAIDAPRLEQQLERGEAPYMRHVAPVMSLVQQLPPGLCERLLALPVRRDPRTGTVDVAVVDARDPHPVQEVAHWLRAPVRMVRTSLAAMDAALRRLDEKSEPGVRPLAAPIWVPTPGEHIDLAKTPAYGLPAVEENKPQEPEEDKEDIPIPLKRRSSFAPTTVVEVGPPALEKEPTSDGEPVLDLRKRKPSSPPEQPLLPVSAIERIRAAEDRDLILELVVEGVRSVAPRVAVFAVRKDSLIGWTCSPEMADRTELRAARFTPGPETALHGVLASEGATFVRIPKDATHAPLLGGLSRAPAGDVALATIRVESRPVAVVMADGFLEELAIAQRLEEVAQAASEALARLLRERRK